MNKPELYSTVSTETALQNIGCLDIYAKKIKWNNERKTVIDLGCGDGSFTALLKKEYIPENYEIVACDLSENMVNFANEKYGDRNTKFIIWDIQADVPQQFIGAFNHVFSFLTFHWIIDQRKAFRNTYDLLAKGGDCLLTIIGYLPIYEIYIMLRKTEKWSSWLKELDSVSFISPYHKVEKPENQIIEIMETIGYKDVDVKSVEKMFSFKTITEFKVLVRSLEPFRMPEDVFEDFMLDFLEASHSIKGFNIKENGVNEPNSVEYNYRLIMVYASK